MKNLDTPIYLEIYLEEGEEVSPDFLKGLQEAGVADVIKEELFDRMQYAVLQNIKEFPLFRLVYYGVDLRLQKPQYGKLLNKLLETYQEEEDYLKCIEIKNLIEKL
jgi:hypothetical protein